MKISTKSIVNKLVRKSKLSKNHASEVTLDTLATSKPEEDDFVEENTYHESFSSIETGIQYDVIVSDDDASAPSILSDDEVRGLFCLWNDALATLNPDTVASRYSSKPCLLPTVSDIPRTDFHSIKDYFVHFLEKKPHGTILESFVTTGPGWCMDNGIYEFSLQATGDTVKARYSFVYTKEGEEWKISHHHSSQMPEEIVPKTSLLNNIVDGTSAPIPSEDEVRGLFCLWNDALSTLNPDTVASRYSSKPCLLPTVSDIPRTDFHSIKDYFVHFLEKKPHGTILESFVTTGPGWCMDNGIYEFSLQATGDTVKARYSFVYTKEGEEWKISHHHSSQMPEEIVPKTSLLNNIVDDLMLGLVFGV